MLEDRLQTCQPTQCVEHRVRVPLCAKGVHDNLDEAVRMQLRQSCAQQDTQTQLS